MGGCFSNQSYSSDLKYNQWTGKATRRVEEASGSTWGPEPVWHCELHYHAIYTSMSNEVRQFKIFQFTK